jgi:hypothetical protein
VGVDTSFETAILPSLVKPLLADAREKSFFPAAMKAEAVGFYRQLRGFEGELSCFLFRNVRDLESVSGVTSKAFAD